VVDPLPRQGGPSARIGSLLHGWIERQGSGQGSLLSDDGAGPPASGPRSREAARIARLKAAFLASPYGGLCPLAVERPFALAVEGWLVRGRVDAVYQRDGRIEVVDFKTGRRPAADDRAAGFQLDLYALAAVDAWGHPPATLRTTEWYLEAGEGTSRDLDAGTVEAVRGRLAGELAALAGGRFVATPGSYCGHCDFLSVCGPGRARLGEG
jgi:DNA helicase-2/ATP-dependent DNA helicase PcrA